MDEQKKSNMLPYPFCPKSSYCFSKGFSVISKARQEDIQKSNKLKEFYNEVNLCLGQLDERVLPILETHFGGRDIFKILREQMQRLGKKDHRILVAGNWHFKLHVSGKSYYF